MEALKSNGPELILGELIQEALQTLNIKQSYAPKLQSQRKGFQVMVAQTHTVCTNNTSPKVRICTMGPQS